MSRDQIIRIAMVVCVVIILCTVIITTTDVFGRSGTGGYTSADRYTAGGTEITAEIRNLDINWTGGKVTVAFHPEKTVVLEESAKRSLPEDEQLHWWVDGDTLRVQYAGAGIRLSMPEKELTLTLPEGIALEKAAIRLTSGDAEIPAMKAEKLELSATSGKITAAAETEKADIVSTSGDITVFLPGKTKEIKLGSTSGSIRLEAGRADKIEAGSTSGSISVTAEECGKLKAGSTSGSICADLRQLEEADIGATSGSVTVRLPEKPGFTAKVDRTSGSFDSDVALTRDGSSYVCGDGSTKVKIGTTSGNIRIEAAEEK